MSGDPPPNGERTPNEDEESQAGTPGASDDDGETETDEPEPSQEAYDDTPNDIDLASLSRAERVRIHIKAVPDAVSTLREKWGEEQIQVVFLVYSLLATFTMATAMLYDITLLLWGTLFVYASTAIPVLYLYEEHGYFDADDNPFLVDD